MCLVKFYFSESLRNSMSFSRLLFKNYIMCGIFANSNCVVCVCLTAPLLPLFGSI